MTCKLADKDLLIRKLMAALRYEHVALSSEFGPELHDSKHGYHESECTRCALLRKVELPCLYCIDDEPYIEHVKLEEATKFDPLEWAKPVLKAMSPGTSLLERMTVILRGQHHALDQMNYNTTDRPNFIDTYHVGKCDTCTMLREAVSHNEPRY